MSSICVYKNMIAHDKNVKIRNSLFIISNHFRLGHNYRKEITRITVVQKNRINIYK